MKKSIIYAFIPIILMAIYFICPQNIHAANYYDDYKIIDKSKINSMAILDSKDTKDSYDYHEIMGNEIVIIPVKAMNTGIMYLDSHFKSFYTVQELYTSIHSSYNDALNGLYEYNYTDTPQRGGEEWIADAKASSGEFNSRVEPVENRGDIMPVTAGKTYYISIYSKWSDEFDYNDYINDEKGCVGVRTYIYSTLNRTLKTGDTKYILSSGINSSLKRKSTWFEVIPNKTGVLKINIENVDDRSYHVSSSVYLQNKNKEYLSNAAWTVFNSSTKKYEQYFGVKKGVKYYIKVSNYTSYNFDNNDETFQNYGIKCSVIERTDRSLGTKSKAKKLVRKAKATNTLFVASKTKSTDWYKIYVPYTKKTRIYFDMSNICSGNCYISIYKNGKQIGKTKTVGTWGTFKGNIVYGKSKGKASKGTYYIKVVKGTKASGKYSIRHVY